MSWWLLSHSYTCTFSIHTATDPPITPTYFKFPTLGTLAANGSSTTVHCSNVTLGKYDAMSTCNTPASSVLFDGNIPTLTGLDGDTWASQLMILHQFGYNAFNIEAHFSYRRVGRIEVTIFNCPQWGTGVQSIQVRQSGRTYTFTVYPTVLSCESLLRICIPVDHSVDTRFEFNFGRYSVQTKVHIAEIAFYNGSLPCPLFTTIPGAWSQPEEVRSRQNSVAIAHNICSWH